MTINDDAELKRILTTIRTVASVGVSASPEKPSYAIFAYLKDHGYEMMPVNPTATEIQGRKVYPNLRAIDGKIDIVQVFRKPEDVPPVVDEAIQVGASVVWMQEGVINEAAAQKAEAAGLKVVMNRCMRATHRRLLGEQFHL